MASRMRSWLAGGFLNGIEISPSLRNFLVFTGNSFTYTTSVGQRYTWHPLTASEILGANTSFWPPQGVLRRGTLQV